MTHEQGEILSRFFDGEAVDEGKLVDCLAQPGASDLLVEFARLRKAIRAEIGLPDEEFCDAMRRRLRTSPLKRFLQRRLVPSALAASLAFGAAAVGYGIRSWQDWRQHVGPSGAQVAGTKLPATPALPATQAAPMPLSAPTGQTGLRPVIPEPRSRVPFAQWRERSSSN